MKLPVAKPEPFNPSLIAPMGSMGDDFDGRIPSETKAKPNPAVHPRSEPKPKPKTVPKGQVVVFASTPLWAVLTAYFAQPLGQEGRSLLAFAAVLMAVVILILLNTRLRGMRGAWRNYVAIALAVPFLAVSNREPLDRPMRGLYLSRIQPMLRPAKQTRGGIAPSPLQQRRESWASEIDKARHHMQEAAELAGHLVVECEGEKVILVGNQGSVSASPQWGFYQFVPVINVQDDCVQAYLRRHYGTGVLAGDDPVTGTPAPLRDRFSPEGRWLYGTYVKGDWILVWSPGPDGRMDFSPIKEFRVDDENLIGNMALKSYDPTNGMMSSGDLMEAVPLPEPEPLGWDAAF